MDATFTVEYNSTDAIATDFIERISLEMKKLGIFKFSNKKEKSSKSLENKAVENPLLEELEYIKKNYKDNWDGEGAKPINEVVFNNCVQIAKECDTKILKNWHLDLDNKGYIVFSANDNNGSIRIMGNTMSYFLTKGKKHLMNKSVNYSVVAFSNLLKLWNYAKNEH